MPEPRAVLVTGATGRIGRSIIPQLAALDRYQVRSGHRHDQTADLGGLPNPVRCLIEDPDSLRESLVGVDTVVHLAANAGDAPYAAEMVPNNILGPQYLCEAALEAGVRRIIFASTNHVVFNWFHDHQQAPETVTPRPDSLYGVTKAYGEILGRFYVERKGLPSFISLRIGWFLPPDHRLLRQRWQTLFMWLSPRDFVDLVTRCIDAPESLRYDCFNAVSDNDRTLLPIDHAREVLGYAPQDNSERYVPEFEGEIPAWLVSRRP
ncbi:MAG: NAD(P)-dependent oxidoreductase [Armatimonadetes bacterium]|nr:NAD(P)-dependent oxidoreductase [Armatimonadota bacterium]